MSSSEAAGSDVAGERWAALEANPEVMTKLCHQVGVSPLYQVVDVWGLDPDLLAFVPQPVVALVLLFPSRNEKGEKSRDFLTVEPHEISGKVYYLRQLEGHLDNACGTIAMIHGILNNRDILGVTGANCVAERFYQETVSSSGEERGKFLDTFQEIVEVHNKLVVEGQSGVVEAGKVSHHFVCVTAVEGHLVELDGAYNSGPNIISKLQDGETLLTAAAKFVQEKYIQQSGGNIQFALMALVMGQGD